MSSVRDGVLLSSIDESGDRVREGDRSPLTGRIVPRSALASAVAAAESDAASGAMSGAGSGAPAPRWLWESSAAWYPELLRAGVRVHRCVDLRLCRAILRRAEWTRGTALHDAEPDAWDAPPSATPTPHEPAEALFTLEEPSRPLDPLAEWDRQSQAIARSDEPGRLRLLTAAESVGSLVAAELHHVGLPWSADRHRELLETELGPRPTSGARPARMEAVLAEVRSALDEPALNPDSPDQLLRGLQTAGLRAESTRSWELKEIDHPAIPPLLEYKRLARLWSANGWSWLDDWVHDGRFRPTYVPAGVVTGRWASDGGGALQLPRQLRGAVVADPGWTLVVADAAQLEPRILAAMSGDEAMARAGRSQDMYDGIVATGAVADRREAKYGMLGAIYGGTSGVSGRVLPRLRRAFPRAMETVELAAREGEEGRPVRTWLGRTSPAGADAGLGYDETRSDAQRRADASRRRSWGRFTRNFVVQGSAAEWALCWMGAVRRRLWETGEWPGPPGAVAPFAHRPHLAFFVHDELVVHAPVAAAEQVAEVMRASAAEAGRLMFGAAPVEWALSVAIVDSYDRAK